MVSWTIIGAVDMIECLHLKSTMYQYQFGCGILKMVGPKKQKFWPRINILKGNHSILRIRGAPVRQKLDMILENKVFP